MAEMRSEILGLYLRSVNEKFFLCGIHYLRRDQMMSANVLLRNTIQLSNYFKKSDLGEVLMVIVPFKFVPVKISIKAFAFAVELSLK